MEWSEALRHIYESHLRMYVVEYTEQAHADLAWFKKHEQNVITDGIDQYLRHEPDFKTRRRKILRPNPTASWELRIGDFRVLYDVDVQVQVVVIKRIGEKRGNAFFFGGKQEAV